MPRSLITHPENLGRITPNMDSYIVPAHETRSEITVVNSRFIATITPVFSVESAKAFIRRIKSEFSDASHNVPAYIIGHGPSIVTHCNDDGEPSGTAGRPALAILQGSGLGDVSVVVTRYFGGTKLGKGGLVRAYGDAVRAVLSDLTLAEKIPTRVSIITLPYSLYEKIRILIKIHHGKIEEEEFTSNVTITFRTPVDKLDGFQKSISELSRGKIQAKVLKSNDTILMPVKINKRDNAN
jgi:uncharacterized YigZ family protein